MPDPKKILITAGPTREMLDPVRFLSNLSTGEMGYTLAQSARDKGYRVTLISGPASRRAPSGVKFVPVVSAADLMSACKRYFPSHSVLIMTAAVCDFTFLNPKTHKIRRAKTKEIFLKQTPDIVAHLASRKGNRLVIGFCLETRDWLRNARQKLKKKRLDGIVANFYTPRHVPFGRQKITAAFIDRRGRTQLLKSQTKKQLSARLLHWIDALKINSDT